MDNSGSEVKRCENCKHYKKHYFWLEYTLMYASSGHCIKRKLKNLVRFDCVCDKWELQEESLAIPYEQLKKALKRTAKQINEIASVLKADD